MTPEEAREIVRAGLRRLPDTNVRNLMEHAANKTPIIHDARIRQVWVSDGAG